MGIRLGLFGVGRIGTFHAHALRAHPDVDAVVLFDPDRARAEQVAASIRSQVAASQEDLAGRADAVVIATPTASHAELIYLCLDAGLPAFCEKPVALHLSDMRRVVEHVSASNGTLQVGFQRRFDTAYEEARRRRQQGALGRVYAFRMATHDPAPPPPGYIATSGGIFRDLHIHDFDILRFVLGREVEEVYACGSVLAFEEFAGFDDYDTAAAVLRLTDGTLGILSGTRHDPVGYDVRMEVFGSRDVIAVGLDDRTPIHSLEPGSEPGAETPHRDFQHRFAAAYRRELAHFVDVAQGIKTNPCTARDAFEALRIATAADHSAREGRPVRLEEIS